jgi:16S rRNA (guanine527-N7)-methyltransferase
MKISMKELLTPATYNKILIYEKILKEWNRRTTLVQVDSLAQFEMRHALDSYQIFAVLSQLSDPSFFKSQPQKITATSREEFVDPLPLELPSDYLINPLMHIDPSLSFIDVGSGAGFPGMILAICGLTHMTLCESNYKKCLFLEEVARQTNTKVNIINDRVENIKEQYHIILSRACTDLDGLCNIISLLSPDQSAVGIFHKGRTWKIELQSAKLHWSFDFSVHKSLTSSDGVLLSLNKVVKS